MAQLRIRPQLPLGRTRRPELLVDAAVGVVVTVVVAVAITANIGGGRGPDLVAYLFALGLGLLMLVRRRYPVLSLVATGVGIIGYYVADYPPIGLAVPVAAALYSAAEQGRVREAVGTAGALLAISTFFRVREGADLAYLFGYELAWSAALMAGAIALGDGVRSRRRWRAEQAKREERMLLEREQRAALERLSLARDLHDVLAHTVTVISLQSDVAAEALEYGDPDAAQGALATIRSASDEAARELRSTVALLRRPAEAEPRAPAEGTEDLEHLVRSTTHDELDVRLRTQGEAVSLPAVVDATAYRIVQEALTNVVRHANASRADVLVRYGLDQLEVRVTDDGIGGSGGGTGHGLVGMRERAELLGGSLRAGTADGGGFEVAAWLPLGGR